MRDPRYSIAMLDWLACAARGGRDEPRGAGRARAGRSRGARGHLRPCAGLRRHLSARPRAPERAHGAGRAGGGGRARPDRRRRARGVRRGLRGHGRRGAGQPPRALRQRLASDRGLRRGRGRRGGRRAARRAARGRRGDRAAAGRRVAGGVRLGRQVAAGRVGGGLRGGGRAARARGRARVRSRRLPRGFQQATGGRYAEPAAAGTSPGAAGHRRQLDQGLALLPADARRDRGRRSARRRRSGRPARDRPPGLAAGRGATVPSPPTACRRSSRSRTSPPTR